MFVCRYVCVGQQAALQQIKFALMSKAPQTSAKGTQPDLNVSSEGGGGTEYYRRIDTSPGHYRYFKTREDWEAYIASPNPLMAKPRSGF